MAEVLAPEIKLPDPVEVSKAVSQIAERSQRLVSDFLQRQSAQNALALVENPGIGKAFLEMTQRLMADPFKLMEAQVGLWTQYVSLWQQGAAAMLGQRGADPLVKPARSDKRFKHEDWEHNALFDFIKQSYLLTSQWVQSTVAGVEGIDERTKKKLEFYTKQFVDALAPTNFAATNPEVIRTTLETGGENLLKGLTNLLEDLERGKGSLSIRMTDLTAFQPGVNIAATPGKVVFQNELMQLLQYSPSTESVYRKPLLIVPPWINKFYILDLRDKNSFIRWAVAQGNTVFVISWVNPDASYAARGFDDYLEHGITAALQAIERATGEREVNAVGYCLGGTLLSASTAWYAAGDHQPIASTTLFTTMLDFARPGELEVFIDDQQLDAIERRMQKQGYLDGAEMASTFNMLRANDLIWSFAVNNYLLGKDPFPFDLLYWNSDSTRMPAAMHSFYLRTMYMENRLIEPGGIEIDGTPIDLGKIKVPCYFISTIEDHIAPWKSTYMGARLPSGNTKFVLGGSGHIAGIVNPPAANKYGFWTNDATDGNLPESPEDFLAGATQNAGSWWTHWNQWVTSLPGGSAKVKARKPEDGALKVIEDAPGSYVKFRLDAQKKV